MISFMSALAGEEWKENERKREREGEESEREGK